MTAIITGERGENALTRHGLEEYVSDCVVLLDHRVANQISTRRLRIVKYRGSTHGTNEFPFLIDERGIDVMPITSLGLKHIVTSQRISTGIPRLDTMLGGKGYFRGSTILVSGTAGTGKTSVAAHFVDAACQRGERSVFFAFEESPSQIIRNMRSIGIDLQQWVGKGLLHFYAEWPTVYGLEAHLASMEKIIDLFKPKVVIVDPVTNLISVGSEADVKAMLIRLLDRMKSNQTTALFTTLTGGGGSLELTEVGTSSLTDTRLLLRDIEIGGERNRTMYILKSRGMAHSNQIREFLLTDKGVDLLDVYVGPSGMLTGSARISQESQEKDIELAHQQEIERKKLNLEIKCKALEAQIASLRAQFQAEEQELKKLTDQEKMRQRSVSQLREEIARMRKEDENSERRNR
jgi:circadian clock protein KaiC